MCTLPFPHLSWFPPRFSPPRIQAKPHPAGPRPSTRPPARPRPRAGGGPGGTGRCGYLPTYQVDGALPPASDSAPAFAPGYLRPARGWIVWYLALGGSDGWAVAPFLPPGAPAEICTAPLAPPGETHLLLSSKKMLEKVSWGRLDRAATFNMGNCRLHIRCSRRTCSTGPPQGTASGLQPGDMPHGSTRRRVCSRAPPARRERARRRFAASSPYRGPRRMRTSTLIWDRGDGRLVCLPGDERSASAPETPNTDPSVPLKPPAGGLRVRPLGPRCEMFRSLDGPASLLRSGTDRS